MSRDYTDRRCWKTDACDSNDDDGGDDDDDDDDDDDKLGGCSGQYNGCKRSAERWMVQFEI